MPIEIGTLLENRYKIKELIGSGGTADVFLAEDLIKKNDVAIKLLKDDLAKDPKFLEIFQKEVTILSCLTSEYIVKVYGYYFYEDRPFIINEYIKGYTLKDLLDNRGMLPASESVDYMIQLTEALKTAHEKGVIHRDVKPLNVFILKDGLLKLADFGIADIEATKTISNSKTIVGSVHYLAPEITLGKPASEASDIYACGVVFYEMLTGHVPFDKDTPINTALAHVHDKFPLVKTYVPNINPDIEEIIKNCTKKNPSDRYKNVGELFNDLCRVINGEPISKKKVGFFARLFGAR